MEYSWVYHLFFSFFVHAFSFKRLICSSIFIATNKYYECYSWMYSKSLCCFTNYIWQRFFFCFKCSIMSDTVRLICWCSFETINSFGKTLTRFGKTYSWCWERLHTSYHCSIFIWNRSTSCYVYANK